MLLGIDIGGTKIAYALSDNEGRVTARFRRPTQPSGEVSEDLARILADIRELRATTEGANGRLDGIGVSVPGPLDPSRRCVILPPNLLNWKDVSLADCLEAEFGCPACIENDANAAAWAEWQLGAGQGLRDLVFLTMSTGVGAGLIVGGRLYRGEDGNAGEVGHTSVEWQGEACECGLRGCLEAYVGGNAWTGWLRKRVPDDNICLELAEGRENFEPAHLLQAAGSGDAWACAQMDRFNSYLARAIVNLAFTLAPQAIILGTIPIAAGDELCFEPIRRMVGELLWPHQAPSLQILPAALGDELPFRAGIGVALAAHRDRTPSP